MPKVTMNKVSVASIQEAFDAMFDDAAKEGMRRASTVLAPLIPPPTSAPPNDHFEWKARWYGAFKRIDSKIGGVGFDLSIADEAADMPDDNDAPDPMSHRVYRCVAPSQQLPPPVSMLEAVPEVDRSPRIQVQGDYLEDWE